MRSTVLIVSLALCAFCTQAQNVNISYSNGYVERYDISEIAETVFTAASDVSAEYGNIDFVDLGLSVKWATCNLGAAEPYETGQFFAWGETEEKEGYRSDNSATSGYAINWNDKRNDAAFKINGGNWRLPSREEFEELCNDCNSEKVDLNGITCMKFTSKIPGYEDRCIYLPFAGYRTGPYLLLEKANGFYWSSTPCEEIPTNTFSKSLSISNEGVDFDYDYLRHCGFTIRAVAQ